MNSSPDMRLMTPIVLLLLVGDASCGRRLPPPGGPEDNEPPLLEETVPEQMQTGVEVSTRVRFLFDENVDGTSAEKSFRLSPEHEDLRISVRGSLVELWPEEGFFPATTYQVTVGSMLMDERNNKFRGPYTLYFATGDSMDTGTIRGKVTHRSKRAGGAYVTATTLPDSVRYHAQADSTGTYILAHLPEGRFHVRAFLDRNGDGSYRFAVEPIAHRQLELLGESVTVDFALAVVDTSPPVLESVETPDSVTVRLVFDDPLDVEGGGLPVDSISLYPETAPERVVPLLSAEVDTAAIEVLVVRTAVPLTDATRYVVETAGVVNEAGLPGRTADTRKRFTYYRL